MTEQDLVRRKPRMRRETFIVLGLLLIPLIGTLLVMVPRPAEYELEGEIIPISEIGIDGSVHYTIVRSGIVRNAVERFWVARTYSDEGVIFRPIEPDMLETYEESLEETWSIESAVEGAVGAVAASADSEDAGGADGLDVGRVQTILAELDDYHGDSMGLMLAIGLYEETHGVNFSRLLGATIAGTGAIDEAGDVWSVGAIEQKLAGASAEHADIFFVPADYDWYGEEGNEAEASRVKQARDLAMDIVPVASLEEAIDYLMKRSSKEE
jgi:Lon-like protease